MADLGAFRVDLRYRVLNTNRSAASASKAKPTMATGVFLLKRPTTMTTAATTATIGAKFTLMTSAYS